MSDVKLKEVLGHTPLQVRAQGCVGGGGCEVVGARQWQGEASACVAASRAFSGCLPTRLLPACTILPLSTTAGHCWRCAWCAVWHLLPCSAVMGVRCHAAQPCLFTNAPLRTCAICALCEKPGTSCRPCSRRSAASSVSAKSAVLICVLVFETPVLICAFVLRPQTLRVIFQNAQMAACCGLHTVLQWRAEGRGYSCI